MHTWSIAVFQGSKSNSVGERKSLPNNVGELDIHVEKLNIKS